MRTLRHARITALHNEFNAWRRLCFVFLTLLSSVRFAESRSSQHDQVEQGRSDTIMDFQLRVARDHSLEGLKRSLAGGVLRVPVNLIHCDERPSTVHQSEVLATSARPLELVLPSELFTGEGEAESVKAHRHHGPQV
jgi:hypothetical protein